MSLKVLEATVLPQEGSGHSMMPPWAGPGDALDRGQVASVTPKVTHPSRAPSVGLTLMPSE